MAPVLSATIRSTAHSYPALAARLRQCLAAQSSLLTPSARYSISFLYSRLASRDPPPKNTAKNNDTIPLMNCLEQFICLFYATVYAAWRFFHRFSGMSHLYNPSIFKFLYFRSFLLRLHFQYRQPLINPHLLKPLNRTRRPPDLHHRLLSLADSKMHNKIARRTA